MITSATAAQLREWAQTYNDPQYFQEDPIAFPTHFAALLRRGEADLKDVEVAAVFAGHFAWGRRSMIVRDTKRLLDEMDWKPYDYVMRGTWRDDDTSAHRTVKWSECAAICSRLKAFYEGRCYAAVNGNDSLERLSVSQIRQLIYGQKEEKSAPNKKINMMRRWMVRDDGKVDLGLWKDSSPSELVIPLDVHVYDQATALGLTDRKSKDIRTALQITDALAEIFPADPCLGDYALFGYGVTHQGK